MPFSSQILTSLADASILFLLGAGFTLIYGVTRTPNLSLGSLAMLGACAAGSILPRLPPDPVGVSFGIVAAAMLIALLGGVIETGLLHRLHRLPTLFQVLATLGIVLIVRDLTLRFGKSADFGGMRPPVVELVQIALGPLVLGGLLLILKHTRWGAVVRAAMLDRHMVAALGVDQRWLCGSVAALGAGLAGLAGALALPTVSATPSLDIAFLTEAIVVAVAGGVGSVTGAYVAALLIGLLQAFGVALLPQAMPVLAAALLAAVLIVRPTGLLGRPEIETRSIQGSGSLIRRAPLTIRLLGTIALLLAIAAPLVVGPDTLSIIIEAAIAILFAASLHVMMGPGGMPSLGHAAFFGIGAYAAALLARNADATMSLALIAAPLAAGLAALLVGAVIVRLGGVTIALLTLVFAQTVWTIADRNGGFHGIAPAPWARDPAAFYWLTLALCIGATLLLLRALAAPFGYALRATRDNAIRARAIGLPIHSLRLAAFTLAGAAAGLAGGLTTFGQGGVSSADLDFGRSIDAVLMVLLGGLQALSGPIVGALAYTGLQDTLMQATSAWRLLLGLAVIALVLLVPAGIAGASIRSWRRGV